MWALQAVNALIFGATFYANMAILGRPSACFFVFVSAFGMMSFCEAAKTMISTGPPVRTVQDIQRLLSFHGG